MVKSIFEKIDFSRSLLEKPYKYSVKDLSCALIIGGCGKLLGFLGIVWRHITIS